MDFEGWTDDEYWRFLEWHRSRELDERPKVYATLPNEFKAYRLCQLCRRFSVFHLDTCGNCHKWRPYDDEVVVIPVCEMET